jgi:hypothetical protein
MSNALSKLLAAGLLVAFGVFVPASSQAEGLALGAKVGGNWSLLSKPSDPAGQPSLLSGSAFDGMGFLVGGTVHYPLVETQGAVLEFEGGLLFSRHSAAGFEQDPQTGNRRDVTLQANMLRVPLLVHMRRGTADTPASGFRLGVGLEPMLGLQSGAIVDPGPEKLHTTPTSHLGATVALGFDYGANTQLSIPLEFRATWDPFVADNTVERFEDFNTSNEPGNYQVAYNWQLFFMTGVRWQL